MHDHVFPLQIYAYHKSEFSLSPSLQVNAILYVGGDGTVFEGLQVGDSCHARVPRVSDEETQIPNASCANT